MELVVYRFIEQSHDFHIWHNEALDIMEVNRTCKGNCKKFQVKKPTGQSRYGSEHGRCQICDVWMDYRGCRLKDGSPAIVDSVGWFCICCNYQIRQNPRNTIYKKKLMTKDNKSNTNETSTNSELHKSINSNDESAERSLEDIREDIQSRFEDKYMLKLFDILDHNITQYDKTKLKNTIHHLE